MPDHRLNCQYCGRLFISDMLVIHQKKCLNVFMKRREPYMTIKYRLLKMPVIKSDIQFINKLD